MKSALSLSRISPAAATKTSAGSAHRHAPALSAPAAKLGLFLERNLAGFGSYWFVFLDFCSIFGRFGFVFFFVVLVDCHCKFLAYQVLQSVGAAENWVRLA